VIEIGVIDLLLVMIWSWMQIWMHFPTSLSIVEWGILGDLLAVLIQLSIAFHETWRNDWWWRGNDTFSEQSCRHPDPNQSRNLYLNPRPLLVEASKVRWVRCTWCWQRRYVIELLSLWKLCVPICIISWLFFTYKLCIGL